ncbi:SDR family oxidoreductase [Patescibacteria group bacterium]
MILVTGGTGHIGNVLAKELIKKDEKIRLLLLPNEDTTPIKGLDVEIVHGDVRDLDSLKKAMQGIRVVFHLAGIITILSGKGKLLEEVNVGGTKNVVRACLEVGVERLVYTSSIHALVEPPWGELVTEKMPIDPDKVVGAYAKSKARATLAVLKGVEQGLDAVMVCPSGVIGPYDYKLSEMGMVIIRYAKKKFKIGIKGSYDFVDVRDVARGIVLAEEKGRKGEIYLLSNNQLSISKLFSELEKLTGIKAPKFSVPLWLVRLVAPFFSLYAQITHTVPLFTSYSMHTLSSNSNTDHSKASQELGYTTRSHEETIRDSYEWFKKEGKI